MGVQYVFPLVFQLPFAYNKSKKTKHTKPEVCFGFFCVQKARENEEYRDVESAISILRGLKERYEIHHKVQIQDEAIVGA